MDFGDFYFVLNNHFIVRHCTAREGFDTPTNFHCTKGLRKWSRFFYLVQGQIDFTSHTGKKIRIGNGDILFLPFDIEYHSSWINREGGRYFSVEFILEKPDGGNINLFEDITLLFHDGGRFLDLFEQMRNTVLTGTLGFQLKAQEQFLHLLYQMAMHLKGNDVRFRDIQPAIHAIENNFYDKIDVDALAEICNISPATLRRRFIDYAGMSPIKYRNFLRLVKARELIGTGLYKISEVAAIVGIQDVYFFSKIYKQQFGISPSKELPK